MCIRDSVSTDLTRKSTHDSRSAIAAATTLSVGLTACGAMRGRQVFQSGVRRWCASVGLSASKAVTARGGSRKDPGRIWGMARRRPRELTRHGIVTYYSCTVLLVVGISTSVPVPVVGIMIPILVETECYLVMSVTVCTVCVGAWSGDEEGADGG